MDDKVRENHRTQKNKTEDINNQWNYRQY